jgi:colicin import membrane protein
MNTAALAHDALLPRPPGGTAAGAVLALLAHAVLILALTAAVNWRANAPEVVSAELWASVPQIAAPRPAEPAPPPRAAPAPAPRAAPVQPDADIAIERERQRKAEARKALEQAEQKAAAAKAALAEQQAAAEAERKRQAADKKKAADKHAQELREAKADEDRLARQREQNLKRMMGDAGGPTSTAGGAGTAAQNAAPSASYAGRLVASIRPRIVYNGDAPSSAAAEVEVRTTAGGAILSRRILKSSGYPDWDDAVLRALDRTPTLPQDTDGRVPPTLIITFRRLD